MYYENAFITEPEEHLLGKLLMWPFLILMAIALPVVRMWFLLGTITAIWSIIKGKKEGGWRNYFAKELVFGLNPFSNHPSIWDIVPLWPIEAIKLAISGEPHSYQTDFRLERFNEYRRDPQNYGMHLDTIQRCIREEIKGKETQGAKAAEKISEIYVEGRRPLAAAVMASALTFNPCLAQTKEKKSIAAQVEIFSDWSLERQLWFRFYLGPWIVYNQNRLSADGKSFFSHIGAGRNFQLTKDISATFMMGPQYTLPLNQIDRVVGFVNFRLQTTVLDLVLNNRLSWGLNSKTPFAQKHVQNIGISYISWIRLRSEEVRSIRKWREFQVGPEFHFSKSFLKYLKFWPYYDFARHSADLKIHFILNF